MEIFMVQNPYNHWMFIKRGKGGGKENSMQLFSQRSNSKKNVLCILDTVYAVVVVLVPGSSSHKTILQCTAAERESVFQGS